MSAGLRVGVSSGHRVLVMGESKSRRYRREGIYFISQKLAPKDFGLEGQVSMRGRGEGGGKEGIRG